MALYFVKYTDDFTFAFILTLGDICTMTQALTYVRCEGEPILLEALVHKYSCTQPQTKISVVRQYSQ